MYCSKDALIQTLQARLCEQEYLLVALDGRCASGKTTLATELQAVLPCTVLHMDDFFLRPEQRTQARLSEPGGNVDRERFASEVLAPLVRHESFSFRPFQCRTQTLGEPIFVTPERLTIVEGAYACHPALRNAYDLRIFSDIDAQAQIERIRRRNGDALCMFQSRWIPLEELYFSAFDIQKHCEITIGQTS